MSDLPTGTVTFLFTDIEGSTRLWEQNPEAMRLALARHDTLLRSTIEANGGSVFKTVGDQFCAVFAHAPEAVEAALSAQRTLLAEAWGEVGPLRVRMALHAGAAEERDGDYFGPPLNRVARLLDAGHGGQILLSQATADLLRSALRESTSLRDLGNHRLKDLQQPEHLFQLVHADLPGEFPPLRSLEAFAQNLPRQLTSFVGREKEMAEVEHLLATSALLTLTGAGGCGKTRLALQVAADVLEQYPDGVWLVELAPLADPTLVPQAVSSVLGVREEPGRPVAVTLTEYLRPKSLLLILDNCEHLLTACAQLAETLLRGCPQLRILASSREGLGIGGEQTYRVPSLALPDARRLPPLERLCEFAVVQLFVDRARLSQAAFAVTEANAPAVVQVCERLDGIPLAIELAAARVKALSVEKLNERLDDMFRLLTGGSRTALPRQQTLRALIDWSYHLLTAAEQALLRRLAVFAGGWTLESAEAVCSDEEDGGAEGLGTIPGRQKAEGSSDKPTASSGVDEPSGLPSAFCLLPSDVLDLLTSLVEKSLVLYDEATGEGRYRLLETVRQYARDRLLEAGEAEGARDRHLQFFLSLAEEAGPQLRGVDPVAWLERLETEHDNLRAALEWSEARSEHTAVGLRLARGLLGFWTLHGHSTEGRGWLDRLLEKSRGVSTEVRAKALLAAGGLACEQSDHSRSLVLLQECLSFAKEVGDEGTAAAALSYLGSLALNQGDAASARTYYEESMALCRELGNRTGIAAMLHELGRLMWTESSDARAPMLFEESLAITRHSGNALAPFFNLLLLGRVARHHGEHATARVHLAESLAIARKVGFQRGQAQALEEIAALAAAEEEMVRAARLFGAAEGVREAIHVPSFRPQQIENDRAVAAARSTLGEELFAAAWAEGRAMTLDDAVNYALEEAPDG